MCDKLGLLQPHIRSPCRCQKYVTLLMCVWILFNTKIEDNSFDSFSDRLACGKLFPSPFKLFWKNIQRNSWHIRFLRTIRIWIRKEKIIYYWGGRGGLERQIYFYLVANIRTSNGFAIILSIYMKKKKLKKKKHFVCPTSELGGSFPFLSAILGPKWISLNWPLGRLSFWVAMSVCLLVSLPHNCFF